MNGDYNHIDLHTCYFETIYSLMDNISNAYKHKFHEALSLRLMKLAVENLHEEDPKNEANNEAKIHFQRNNDVRFSVGVDDA
uniref:GSKIP domain-containing protein n=1 Tax=Romanomermis culicivorax TaxID=13658 RepID=A0A915HX23_ROMCU